MGNCQNTSIINPGIREYINQQFNKVKKDPKRTYLTISEVLQIQHHEDYPFQFSHLGILFVCDKNLDGLFTMQDFQHFALWIQLNLVAIQMYEFKSQLQARTTERLIQIIQNKDKRLNEKYTLFNPNKNNTKASSTSNNKSKQQKSLSNSNNVNNQQKEKGEDLIVQWFLKMIIEDNQTKKIKNIIYIRIQCIKLIYEIFNVKIMTEMDIQSFFYLIKKSSEDLGFPILECQQNYEEQEYIAIPVCQQFIRHFIKGMLKILKDIGYQNTFFE